MIAEYIERDSPDRAELFVTRLFEAVDRLRGFPESGRVVPELNDPARREVYVGPYRVMYKVERDDLWIVTIVHGARDWPNPPREDG